MNFVPSGLRFDAAMSQLLRRRAAINPPTFGVIVFLIEFGVVVALAVMTGILYHVVAYGMADRSDLYLQVGALGAAVYTVTNTARGDYRLGNFLSGSLHSRRILIHWHVVLFCLLAVGFLAQLSVVYSRAWIALFYVSGVLALVPIRRVLTDATLYASRKGIVSARRSLWLALSLGSRRSCGAISPPNMASKSPAAASCLCCPGLSALPAPSF